MQAEGFYPSVKTSGLRPAMDLHGIWFDSNGNRHISPFNYFGRKSIELNKSFDRPEAVSASDTSYLYFEGLAWTADVYLNGKLLKVTQDPFAEHLLPLAPGFLKEKGNELRIHLHLEGKEHELYPEPFLGIFRQAALLVKGGHVHPRAGMQPVSSASAAVVLAPWSQADGYLDDATVLKGMLSGMFRYPHSHPLVFAFRPSSEAQWQLAEMGWTTLGHPGAADSLAFYNSYPVAEQPLKSNVTFWRQPNGRPGSGYGKYLDLKTLRGPGGTSPDRMALMTLLLVPVICLLLMKLTTPRLYAAMLEFLTKTQIYLELIGNNKFLKAEQSLLVNGFRLAISASTVTLFLYYLQETGTLFRLDLFSGDSLLGGVLEIGDYGPYQLLLGVLALLLGLNILKYVFLNMAAGVYRVSGLSLTVQNLDIFASMPFNLLPLLPATFIFFLEAEAGQVALIVWQAVFGIWFLRRIILIYVGLTRLFSFSTSLKFLYICTLEILPWTILL